MERKTSRGSSTKFLNSLEQTCSNLKVWDIFALSKGMEPPIKEFLSFFKKKKRKIEKKKKMKLKGESMYDRARLENCSSPHRN